MNEKNLTADQLRAVLTVDRPLCIRAGAGCGKTGVLAYHYVALLLLKGLKPSEAVAVTFTEKAAGELKARIQEVLRQGVEGRLPFQDQVFLKPVEIEMVLKEIPQAPISTLHSLAARIVREASLLTGWDPHFQVLDENQAHALKVTALSEGIQELLNQGSPALKTLIRLYGFGALKRQLLGMLKDWPRWGTTAFKNAEIGAEEVDIEKALSETFASVLSRYEAFKARRQSLDFDDLEEEALKLLRDHPMVVRHYRWLWRAYLVDEFQDVSEKQDALLSALIPHDQHLAVVGDEKQSIYSFRGAEPLIFEKFQERIEKNGGVTVTLSRNFRSPPLILRWVNALFQGVFKNYPPLEAAGEDTADASLEVLIPPLREEGEKISAEDRRTEEAGLLAERVSTFLDQGTRPSEIFLLFRTMSSLSIYLKAFREKKIPVYVRSSESLLDRQEVLDLIHALRAVAEPENPLPWAGLLRSPAFGVSDEALLRHALEKQKKTILSDLHPLLQSLKEKDRRGGPYEFLEDFLETTELISLYASREELSPKAQNLLQFLHEAHEWESHEGGGLDLFLKELDLLSRSRIPWGALSDRLGAGEAVTLMTIHQAKGLDFPVVVLPDLGAEGGNDWIPIADRFGGRTGFKLSRPGEGLKPETEESETLKQIKEAKKKLSQEEEDRIFYVAVTRAKKRLVLGFPPPEKKNSSLAFSKLTASLQGLEKVSRIQKTEGEGKTSSREEKSIGTSLLKPLQRARLTRFAVTELECFLRSKEEYLERYVHRLPPVSFRSRWEKRKEEGSPLFDPLERGTLLHETLSLMTEAHPYGSLQEAFQSAWDRRFDLHDHREVHETLMETLDRTLKHPNFQPILKPEEGYSEIPFLLSLPPYEIRGAMDRLIRNGDKWRVVDYKTHAWDGRASPSKIAKEFEFQMKTYCLAAGRMIGKPVHEALIYFVEPNLLHSFEFSEGDFAEHEGFLKTLMDEICGLKNGEITRSRTGTRLPAR